MKNINVCKWYDETSGMKRAYDKFIRQKMDRRILLEWGKGCASPS
jgi:hypothetical protein